MKFRISILFFFCSIINICAQIENSIEENANNLPVREYQLSIYYEYQADFGAITNFENGIKYESEIVWNAGAEYLLSDNFSLTPGYNNRFGGGGLSIRF